MRPIFACLVCNNEYSASSMNTSLLTEEILAMAKEDQAMRSSGQWNDSVDQKNTLRMKQIVAETGWPTVSKIGEDAAHAAWLLIQHADHDVAFQEHCLSLMKEESREEVAPPDVAYLEDRIRVSRGLSQLYGTQFFVNADGKFGPNPIEDMINIDQRRKEVGLDAFDDYQKEMETVFQAQKKHTHHSIE